MTGHELLPWAIAIFAVTNTVGAALSVARVYSQRKKKQQWLAPSSHATGARGDRAYAWQPGQKAEPGKSTNITIVVTATAAVLTVVSALLALTH